MRKGVDLAGFRAHGKAMDTLWRWARLRYFASALVVLAHLTYVAMSLLLVRNPRPGFLLIPSRGSQNGLDTPRAWHCCVQVGPMTTPTLVMQNFMQCETMDVGD